MTPNSTPDARVNEIRLEIERRGKASQSHADWKAEFKTKNYADDEIDLGYSLAGIHVRYGPFPPKIRLAILLAPILLWLWSLKGSQEANMLLFFLSLFPFFAYMIITGRQQNKVLFKVLEADFDAEEIKEPKKLLKELKTAGYTYFDRRLPRIGRLFRCLYDKRETWFGEFEYTVHRGKKSDTHHRFIILQQAKAPYPHVAMLSPRELSPEFYNDLKSVQLESPEFSSTFRCLASAPVDAFYVLNPRVMARFLDEEKVLRLMAFETLGGKLLFVYDAIPLASTFKLSPPEVRFDEYKKLKDQLLKALDHATNLNDTLSREIVDTGQANQARSAAKAE